MHLAVAAAVAVATAVLTGALVVGDSVRGSLRDLTLQRLGRIDQALVTPGLFRAELAGELSATDGFDQHFEAALPALVLRGSATARVDDQTRRASELDLFGVTDAFWSAGDRDLRATPTAEGVWLTREVAADLGVKAGDEIVLQLPLVSEVPADSPLGEKVDTVAGQRQRVAGVLPDEGLARFGLQPSQRPPRAVFIALDVLAKAIDKPGRANAILVTSDSITHATDASAREWLDDHFRLTLDDLGLSVEQHDADGEYVQIAAQGMVIPPQVLKAAEREFENDQLQPLATYLANTMRVGDKSISYSTVVGIDSTKELGPLVNDEGNPIVLAENEIALNDWAAEQLGAKVSDTVTIRYYEPESTHGNLREHDPPLELTVTAIVPLERDGKATRAADPNLTPQLEGVTDQESIADWDLPFELTEPITRADEDYWDVHRATPKAFVSFELGRKLWGTRWGDVSMLRLPADTNNTVHSVSERLSESVEPAELGFVFLPVKAQGLAAASGTTPFDGLFLGFSMFLIAAAIMLLVLLFRLGMESRAREIGLLSAVGFDGKRTRQLLSREAMLVAVVGAMVGVVLGIAYAWAMITGLKTLWVAAIAAPFLELHVSPWSLVIGLLLGLFTAWATTWRTLRGIVRQSPRGLLAGTMDEATPRVSGKRRNWRLSELALVGAVALGAFGATQQGEAQAGAFFGVGALALAGMLGLVRRYWQNMASARSNVTRLSLVRLAVANLARRPGRSTLTVGLVAAASFLLLAISAFRLAPTEAGTGGFTWYATSAAPLHYDLGTSDGQLELGFRDAEMDQLAECQVESLRVHGGEDASCLNLYRTAQPRILGVRDADRVLTDFAWTAKLDPERAVPDLDVDLGVDDRERPIVPVVLDFNTAMYSLHLTGGVGSQLVVRDGDDQQVTVEVVGLLQNSILQGDLLMSDANFRRLFPGESGSQLFLIRDKTREPESPLDTMLENRLGDYGFAATSTDERLAGFLAVQNTYLSTFQSLGGLGLLLGTIGLAVVQLRNVLERRGELALVQAVGFSRGRVVAMVLLENLALLLLGLALGGVAAALALLPQLGIQQTSVPWQTMLGLLAIVLLVGVVATWLATRGALRQAILPALRGD